MGEARRRRLAGTVRTDAERQAEAERRALRPKPALRVGRIVKGVLTWCLPRKAAGA